MTVCWKTSGVPKATAAALSTPKAGWDQHSQFPGIAGASLKGGSSAQTLIDKYRAYLLWWQLSEPGLLVTILAGLDPGEGAAAALLSGLLSQALSFLSQSRPSCTLPLEKAPALLHADLQAIGTTVWAHFGSLVLPPPWTTAPRKATPAP